MTATTTRAAGLPPVTSAVRGSGVSPALLQRACSCGRHAVAGGTCEACRVQPSGDQVLQRSAPAGTAGTALSAGDFSRVPAFSATGVVPSGRTATVSTPGDPHEREADAVADAVMQHRSPPRPGPGPAVAARRAATTPAGVDDDRRPDPAPATGGGGHPLPGDTREWFEGRMGQDLRGVRVHDDGDAARMADELSADAFTRGQHVYFARGRYAPHSDTGRRLLAHELTHTVQQRGAGPGPRIDRQAVAAPERAPEELPADDLAPVPPSAAPPAGTGAPSDDLAPAGATVGPAPSDPAPDGPVPDGPVQNVPAPRQATPTGPVPATAAASPAAPQPAAGAVGPAESAPAALDSSSGAGLLSSLAAVPPSRFGAAAEQATAAAATIQQGERDQLQGSLPEIDRPTGLPRRADRPAPEADATGPAVGRAPVRQASLSAATPAPTASLVPVAPVQAPLPAATVPPPQPEPAATEEEDGGWWSWLTGSLSSFLRRLPVSDPAVDTSAGPRPRVDTSGEANPTENDREQRSSATQVTAARLDADAATTAPRGEHDIRPDVPGGTMRSPYRVTGAAGGPAGPPAAAPGAGPGAAGAAMETVNAGVDRAAGPWLAAQVAEKTTQEADDCRTRDEDSTRRRAETRREIAAETARTRGEQVREQRSATEEVGRARDAWRTENLAAETGYATKAEAERTRVDTQVDAKTVGVEREADARMTEAEDKATAKKRETERQAAAKKEEARNRPRGFWSRVRGAISDAFDAIKDAINTLFDALRSFVRGVINAVKAVVSGLIEAARRALVGLIRGFGAFLKGAVTVALGMFPGAAEKARRWIDKTVDRAEAGVNRAAATLQTFAAKALDALAAGLDFVLSVYQRAFTLLVDGLKFLAVGLTEVLEKIAHLVSAATQMPDHFFGQVTEELVGQDLTKPLPFELTEPRSTSDQVAALAAAGDIAPADVTAMTRTVTPDGGVTVDAVAPLELSDELLASMDLAENGSIEFGENSDPSRTVAAIQEEAAAGPAVAPPAVEQAPAAGPDAQPEESATTEQPTVTAAPDTAAVPAAAQTAAPESAEAETERRLTEMMAVEPSPPCPKETSQQPAESRSVPEAMKFGPLSVGQRARYLLSQMWTGIKNWFSCNWPWLLAAAIGILAVAIVLEILTGGAITAAIPPIMQIIGMIMIGVGAVRMAGHVGGYLTKGWGGDEPGAAKDLARGLAIGAIELVFTLLFDLNAVIKAAKQGLAATVKGALATAKTAGKSIVGSGAKVGRAVAGAVRAPGRAAAVVGRAVVQRGRIVMQGLRRGFASGARNLRDLAQRLWNAVRFRRFKLVRSGRRIQLWGYINPWVLMADGTLAEVATTGGRAELGARGTLRSTGRSGGRRGILVGVRNEPSVAVKELQQLSHAERRAAYRRLRSVTQDEAAAILTNRETTAALRRGIAGPQPPFFNAHHLVPRELRGNERLRGFLEKIGFHWEDGARNGLMLPPSRELALAHPPWSKASLHFTSHPNYTLRVERRLTAIVDAYEASLAAGRVSADAAATAARQLDTYLAGLRRGLLNGGVDLR